jgi:hypothetical protein
MDKENNHNLFINDTDDVSEDNNLDHIFISSETSNNNLQNIKSTPKSKFNVGATNAITSTNAITNATIMPHHNSSKELEEIVINSNDKPQSPCSSNLPNTVIINTMLKSDSDINGWDENATTTIKNWYNIFKQQSFIYQWILDRNKKISNNLTIASIIASSSLGIFTGFKLWIRDDQLFQTISNILLMLFNFIVALITACSRSYIDDKRNEKLRVYIEEVDSFLGEISAQVLKSPVYRMAADKFFKLSNDKYTRLISCAPNLSIYEIKQGKHEYNLYYSHCEKHV